MHQQNSLRNPILYAGIVIGVFGILLAYWSVKNSAELSNYQRISCLLPLFYAGVMARVDTFLNWDDSSSVDKIRTLGTVAFAALLTFGALYWFVAYPSERA